MKSENFILWIFIPLILSGSLLTLSFFSLKHIIMNEKLEIFNVLIGLIGGISFILGVVILYIGLYKFFETE